MMRSLIAGCILAAGAALLSACSTTTTGKMLDNLAGCERHYDGAVSGGMTGGQFSGTVKIDCAGAAPASAAPVSAAP